MRRGQWALVLFFLLLIAIIVAYIAASSTSTERVETARAAQEARVEASQAAVKSRRQMAPPHTAEVETLAMPAEELDALLADLKAVTGRGSEWGLLRGEMAVSGAWPPELLAKVEQWLAAHADLVTRARDLAKRGADLEFAALPLGEVAPRVNELAAVFWLLAIHAQALAAQGQYPEALATIEDVMALADLFGSQHMIIAQFGRVSGYNAAFDRLAPLLHAHELSNRQLDEIERRLPDAYQREEFAAAMANEAGHSAATFDDIRGATLGRLLAPIVNWNEASYIEGMNRLADMASRPYHQVAGAVSSTPNLPFTQIFSRTLLRITQPALARAIEAQAGHEARVDMARIAIALERHYLETGGYPDSLQPLAPAFGGELPVDVFTGQPYHYRLTDNGFLLYSLGVNQTDDGGAQDHREGDIVWH